MASFAITQLIVVIALLYTYQAPRALSDILTSRPSIASELNISGCAEILEWSSEVIELIGSTGGLHKLHGILVFQDLNALNCGFVCPRPKLHQIDSRFDPSYSTFTQASDQCAATMADLAKKSLEIFILSGQSNMSGRGGIIRTTAEDGYMSTKWDGILPEECATEPGAILRLNRNLDWEEAHEPLHADIDLGKPCGVGPGLVFAASLLRARKYKVKPTGPQIGLVPCAIGGTSITEWEKGGFLYNQMIKRTKAALEKGGTLKALLWYQGESDCVEKSRAEHYEQRLIVFFNNVRTDLDKHDLPIIQVAIQWPAAQHPDFVEQVRNAQKAVTDQLEHVHLVDAYGLPLASDNIHLTTEAQTKVGLMLLDKYISTGEGKH